MEKILDNLVSEHEESVNTSIDKGTGSNFEVPNNREPPHSTNLSTKMDNLTDKDENESVEEEIDDVMNVLKDLNDVATGTFVSNSNNGEVKHEENNPVVPQSVVESLTSVEDVSKVVDFSKSCINDNSSTLHISCGF